MAELDSHVRLVGSFVFRESDVAIDPHQRAAHCLRWLFDCLARQTFGKATRVPKSHDIMLAEEKELERETDRSKATSKGTPHDLREGISMKRTTLNFWTDALAFIGFAFLATSGILLRYQLPHGSGRMETIGEGQRAQEKPVSVLWGLTRDEWGDVHYYIALGLMAVLAFHLVLHWKWIVCVTRGKPVEGSGYRLGFGIIGLLAVLLLAAAPLFAPSNQMPRSQLQDENKTTEELHIDDESKTIRGEMTLTDVERLTGVPASYILEHLGLPKTTSSDERVGQLRRKHDFQIEDVRRIVSEFKTP